MVKLLLGLTAAAIPFWVLAWLSDKKIVDDVVTAITHFYRAVEYRRRKIKSIVARFVWGMIWAGVGLVLMAVLFLIPVGMWALGFVSLLAFFRWVGWI